MKNYPFASDTYEVKLGGTGDNTNVSLLGTALANIGFGWLFYGFDKTVNVPYIGETKIPYYLAGLNMTGVLIDEFFLQEQHPLIGAAASSSAAVAINQLSGAPASLTYLAVFGGLSSYVHRMNK